LGSKDIVVIGAVMSWEMMEGQRGTQLVNEFLKMGHRILYVEIDPSSNQASYNNETFRLVNVLPRHWAFYDMTGGRKRRTTTKFGFHKVAGLLDKAANMAVGHRIFAGLPWPIRRYATATRKALPTPVDDDLPLIREKLGKEIDDFCRPSSDKVVIFEIPMRPYVECVDLFQERGFKIVYEFIDKWELMWQGEKVRQLDDEKKLVDASHVVVATSKYLMKEFLTLYPWRTDALYLPNAVSRDRFNVSSVRSKPKDLLVKDVTVGYFGSIGEWFDWKTLLHLARSKPTWAFNLIGQYAERPEFPVSAWKELTSLPNVATLGRKKHQDLIRYLAHWELCLIPFLDTPVTRGTSPVKLYEYLSAYKPVVATDSGELRGFPYVYLANGERDFLTKCEEALKVSIKKHVVDDFLERNTWQERARAMLNAWTCHEKRGSIVWEKRRVDKKNHAPLASLIVLNLNTVDLTKEAIESMRLHTDYPYELIVVDNGSTDSSQTELQNMLKRGAIDQLVLLDRNLGYAGGNNEGVRRANGEYYVFVNSDVIVSPNWLGNLIGDFSDRDVGAVGPVSQKVGSSTFPQRVQYQNQKSGTKFDLKRASGFCLAVSKECFEKVGPWDEAFYPGNFDDDDMSVRIHRAGFRIICDGDVFVQHRMMSTFKANPGLALDRTFWENKKKFEAKWPNEPAVIEYPADEADGQSALNVVPLRQ
jgi:GT2 family glycosyltransferase/glycosyltransferase involved in cell wall biosynthesis